MSASLEKGIRVLKEVIDAPIASYFNSCVHCGLCAERCPTGAWDMQKFLLEMAHAGPASRDKPQSANVALDERRRRCR